MIQSRFADTFNRLLVRCSRPVGEIAIRLGVQRGAVYKWLDGSSLPKLSNIAKMRTALAWTDDNGSVHQLTDREVETLLMLAGRSHISSEDLIDFNRAQSHAAQTIVYTFNADFEEVPSTWIRRLAKEEREIPGSLVGVSGMIPSLFRPSQIQRQRVKGILSEQEVTRLEEIWRIRQDAFEKRLEGSTIKYVLNRHNVANYASRSDGWTASRLTLDAVRDHGRILIQLLRDHDNFQIALAERQPQCDFCVLASRRLLIEFPLVQQMPVALFKGTYVMGIEVQDPVVVGCFIEQVESVWAEDSTLKDKERVIEELGRLFSIGE